MKKFSGKKMSLVFTVALLILLIGCRNNEPTFHTVRFLDHTNQIVAIRLIENGEDITDPPTPMDREGYRFLGWSHALTNIRQPINIKPLYELIDYQLIFDTKGGDPIESMFFTLGAHLELVPTPTKEGHTFLGWDPPLPSRMPAEDLYLNALWEPIEYTVYFIVNGIIYDSRTTYFNSSIDNLPHPPSVSRGEFNAWVDELGNTYTEETILAVSQDIHVYAQFTPQIITYDYETIILQGAQAYGYESLSRKSNPTQRETFYQRLYEMSMLFFNSEHNAIIDDDFIFQSIDLSDLKLSFSEIVETYQIFWHDHPALFWLPSILRFTDDTFYYTIDPDYALYETRAQLFESLSDEIAQYINALPLFASTYETVLTLHNTIIRQIDYAYNELGEPLDESWSRNIVGVFDSTIHSAVCVGQAKAYQLLLNLLNIENLYVTGMGFDEAHAWNMVKMDDGNWYLIDLTWNNSCVLCDEDAPVTIENGIIFADRQGPTYSRVLGINYDYFLLSSTQAQYSHVANRQDQLLSFLYDLPELSQSNYINHGHHLSLFEEIDQGNLQYRVIGPRHVEVSFCGFCETVPTHVKYNHVEYQVIGIGDFAFNIMSTHFIVPEGIEYIGYQWMSPGHPQLNELSLSKTVRYIDNIGALDTLYTIHVDPENTAFKMVNHALYSYDGTTLYYYLRNIEESVVVLPTTKVIGNYAFADTLVNEVILPEGLKRIGMSAFRHTRNLENITLPNTLEVIEQGAFHGETALKEISIPASVLGINDSAFASAKHLQNIYVHEDNPHYSDRNGVLYTKNYTLIFIYPAGRTSEHYQLHPNTEWIYSFSFNGVTALKTLDLNNAWNFNGASIPRSVETVLVSETNEHLVSIDGIVYSKDQSTLKFYPSGRKDTTVTIPEGTRHIAAESFYSHPTIQTVIMPDSVEFIGSFAFLRARELQEIILGEDSQLTTISELSLSGTAIDRVFIPKNVEHIYDSSFSGMAYLEQFIVHSENPYYQSLDGVLFNHDLSRLIKYPENKEALEYRVPNSVVDIAPRAFLGSKFTTLYASSQLQTIGYFAFSRAEIDSLYLSKTLNAIGMQAFIHSTIHTIYYEGSETDWQAITLDETCLTPPIQAHTTIYYDYPINFYPEGFIQSHLRPLQIVLNP